MTLHISHLSKSFGKAAKDGSAGKATHVLKDIHIEIAQGEFLILVGPSGCGKSTLLNIIAGLDAPTSGAVYMNGVDVTALPPAQRDIAMVFQSYALYPSMTVAQNIGFALEMRKTPKAERLARIAEVAKLLQIEHLLDRRPAQLSGGQRQRVAMGRALARQPALFLFDEPLSNLDAKLRVEMRAEIKRLHQSSGITSVYVTHDQIEAMTLGSRIAVMNGGVLQQVGTPEQIYNQPANLFVATFMGAPSMNVLPISAELAQALSLPPERIGHTLGLRPEHIRLGEAPSDHALASANGWLGKVTMLEATGADTYVTLQTASGSVVLRAPAGVSAHMGQAVALQTEALQHHFFDGQTGQRLA